MYNKVAVIFLADFHLTVKLNYKQKATHNLCIVIGC